MNQSLRSELRLKLDGQQPPEIKHQFLAFKVVVYGRFDCLFSFYIYIAVKTKKTWKEVMICCSGNCELCWKWRVRRN